MKFKITTDATQQAGINKLARKCFSPLTGIGIQIGHFLSQTTEPDVVCLGAQMTGIHCLLNRPEPKGSYHIGGSGFLEFEAFIKCIAETMERYTQLISGIEFEREIVYSTHDRIKQSDPESVFCCSFYQSFNEEQLIIPNFQFKAFKPDAWYGFIKMESLIGNPDKWVPAQVIFLGYNLNPEIKEQRFMPAVTTGTAVHTDPVKCLTSAILELIQLDATMGNWYGESGATRILPDERTKRLYSILNKNKVFGTRKTTFYYLPNPDIAGFTTACIIENNDKIPCAVVGLGSCTSLESSMYKAYIEAVSCCQLAKIISLNETFRNGKKIHKSKINVSGIADLDTNVFYYSLPEHKLELLEKFETGKTVQASDLQPDIEGTDREKLDSLIGSFRSGARELLFLDISTKEIKDIGMVSFRVWSPQTLSLSIPNSPALAHKRYKAYGGIKNVSIHPFP